MKSILLFSCCLISIAFLSFSPNTKPSLKLAMKTLDDFCQFVPSGNAVIENDTISVQSFYMSTTEITNIQYREFLIDLKRKGENDKYNLAKIDSSAWTTSFSKTYLKPMEEYYSSHPAYNNYPVVNISKKGAELFCDWLTNKYDSLSSGHLNIKFRIPTRAEWIYAANGGDNSHAYSWGSNSLRNVEGLIQANFTQLGSENISRNTESGEYVIVKNRITSPIEDNADLMAPSKSYWPNKHGLYNLNGNVSEIISDNDSAVGGDWHSPGYDIRNESIKPFNEPHPTVGFRVVATCLEEKK